MRKFLFWIFYAFVGLCSAAWVYDERTDEINKYSSDRNTEAFYKLKDTRTNYAILAGLLPPIYWGGRVGVHAADGVWNYTLAYVRNTRNYKTTYYIYRHRGHFDIYESGRLFDWPVWTEISNLEDAKTVVNYLRDTGTIPSIANGGTVTALPDGVVE